AGSRQPGVRLDRPGRAARPPRRHRLARGWRRIRADRAHGRRQPARGREPGALRGGAARRPPRGRLRRRRAARRGERPLPSVACLGAELGPALGSSDGLPLLLLTLGTLRWLAEQVGQRVLVVETGTPSAAGSFRAAPVPGLRVAGDPPVVVAERTGRHRLGDALVLANLFDDRESDIGRDGDRVWPATVRPSAPLSAGGRHEVDWWLYLAAAAL